MQHSSCACCLFRAMFVPRAGLFVPVVVWTILAFGCVITLRFMWLLLVLVALSLNVINVIGCKAALHIRTRLSARSSARHTRHALTAGRSLRVCTHPALRALCSLVTRRREVQARRWAEAQLLRRHGAHQGTAGVVGGAGEDGRCWWRWAAAAGLTDRGRGSDRMMSVR